MSDCQTPLPPRVGLVGVGHWGANLARNLLKLSALEVLCDEDSARFNGLPAEFAAVRRTTSFASVVDDPRVDAVVIATPPSSHADLALEAMRSGKDVFVEKPLALAVNDGERLVSFAEEHRRVLMVGHILWYHPAILKIQEMIKGGELGRIQYVYSNRLNLGRIRRDENIVWSFAPHDISVILGLLNEMPEDVRAQGGNYLHQDVADVTVSLLSFPSGVKAHIFVSWLHPFKEQKLVVVGDRKMVVFDDLADDKLVVYPHSITWKNNFPIASRAEAQPIALERVEPLRCECKHFLESVAIRRRPRTDGHEGLRVLRVLDQCHKALRPAWAPTPEPDIVVPARHRRFFAHDSAFIDDGVEIGEGTSIWHVSHVLNGSRVGRNCRIGQNVVIGPNVEIGDRVKIQNNVSVYEGVALEDEVFCGPSVVFTNVFNPRSAVPRMTELRRTRIKRGATLGANATILCGVTVGQFAFVGAGAVVTHDVPDYALVVGNPARASGWMCECGVKLQDGPVAAQCLTCGRRYEFCETGMRELTLG